MDRGDNPTAPTNATAVMVTHDLFGTARLGIEQEPNYDLFDDNNDEEPSYECCPCCYYCCCTSNNDCNNCHDCAGECLVMFCHCWGYLCCALCCGVAPWRWMTRWHDNHHKAFSWHRQIPFAWFHKGINNFRNDTGRCVPRTVLVSAWRFWLWADSAFSMLSQKRESEQHGPVSLMLPCLAQRSERQWTRLLRVHCDRIILHNRVAHHHPIAHKIHIDDELLSCFVVLPNS